MQDPDTNFYESPTAMGYSSRPPELRHSGIGIASFILSVLAGVGIFVSIVLAGVLQASTPGGMRQDSPQAVFVGLAIIGSMIAELVAGVLGLVALFETNRKKVLAVLGLLFSVSAVLLTIGLMVIGLMAKAR